MVNTHKEYIQLLESELQRRGFAEFKDNEILAFIRRYQLDKRPGIYFKDVRTDSQRLIRLHQQGKAAAASQSDAAGRPGPGQGSPGAVRRAAGRLLTGSSGKTYALGISPSAAAAREMFSASWGTGLTWSRFTTPIRLQKRWRRNCGTWPKTHPRQGC